MEYAQVKMMENETSVTLALPELLLQIRNTLVLLRLRLSHLLHLASLKLDGGVHFLVKGLCILHTKAHN